MSEQLLRVMQKLNKYHCAKVWKQGVCPFGYTERREMDGDICPCRVLFGYANLLLDKVEE